VILHSQSHVILGHYLGAGGAPAVAPDVIFGWDSEARQRRPNPYPVHEAIRQRHLDPREVLVVDDLKPGVDIANAAGVNVATAGWSHHIPAIRDFMKRTCAAYFATIPEFVEFILE